MTADTQTTVCPYNVKTGYCDAAALFTFNITVLSRLLNFTYLPKLNHVYRDFFHLTLKQTFCNFYFNLSLPFNNLGQCFYHRLLYFQSVQYSQTQNVHTAYILNTHAIFYRQQSIKKLKGKHSTQLITNISVHLEFTDAKIENVRSQTHELKSKDHKNKRLLSYKTKNKNSNTRYYSSNTHVVQLIQTLMTT